MHLAINGWFWNKPNTGSGQYTRNLVYYLNRLVSDLAITIIAPLSEGEPMDVPPSVQVERVRNGAGQVGKVVFEQQQFPSAAQKVGATVAHVPYWGSPLSCAVPLVVTIHDLTTELIREYRQGVKARLYNSLVVASAKSADHVITDSDASKADVVERLGISAENITTIYLGVEHETFNPTENMLLDMAVKQQYDLPDDYVLYLGGYEIHKNVPTLLAAYQYVNKAVGDDYPLLLAGKKPTKVSERFPDYDKLIRDYELQNAVRWLGYVEDAHKPLIYREAMTFVFPSRAEGFGFPPLEAMAVGTPVVTTNAKSLPEVVGDAAFAVDPDDVRGMGGAIIATLVQDNLRAEMKAAGIEQAQKFKWENTATQTLLVYDKVSR